MRVSDIISTHLKNEKIIFVDVGAKGGVHELPRLAPWTKAIALEPNPDEFEKLINPTSRNNSTYAHIEYKECALGAQDANSIFYLYTRSSFSSLLKPDHHTLKKHLGLVKQYSNWTNDFKEEKQINVKVARLDTLAKEMTLHSIDYLKLDTQGSELDILKGASELLRKNSISIIKCEVSFISPYENQPLFSDIDIFLRTHDFEFVDCLFYPNSSYEKPTKVNSQAKIWDKPRYTNGGDALYVNNHSSSDSDILNFKKGIILAEFGYLSLAYHFLNKHSTLQREDVITLLKYFGRKSIKGRIKKLIQDWTPPIALLYLKQIVNRWR